MNAGFQKKLESFVFNDRSGIQIHAHFQHCHQSLHLFPKHTKEEYKANLVQVAFAFKLFASSKNFVAFNVKCLGGKLKFDKFFGDLSYDFSFGISSWDSVTMLTLCSSSQRDELQSFLETKGAEGK